jgi:hypothetical protein
MHNNIMFNRYSLVLFYIFFIFSIMYIYLISQKYQSHQSHQSHRVNKKHISSTPATCSNTHTCGAIDPVSNPEYNMKQIIRQSILLEEHLAEDRKYCKDCVCKHFNHILGLNSEGLCLAGDKANNYPHMSECVEFYDIQFQKWLKDRDSKSTRLEICSKLREKRKQLMSAYYLH